MATNQELKELLDERFAAHEARSRITLHEVKAEIVGQLHAHDRRIASLEQFETQHRGWRSWALGIVGALIVAAVQFAIVRK